MSDFRNSDHRSADDPLQRNQPYDPDARAMNATWGWVAAAVFIVVVLAVAFGFGHRPESGTSTAYNDTNPPAATRTAPPVNPAPTTAPAPTGTPAPVAPAPSPAPASGQ
ncbi:MAG TPA: hypothetical protein VHW95_06400 [Steroidobacteraceae bacterium]|nr:hypothetical protein [Steroidobacteraceae bacterium]